MKFETIASPASRSERGRRLQNGFGWTPGAEGSSERSFESSFIGSSGQREPEVVRDFLREVDDELAVVEGEREVVPGQRPGRGAGDVGSLAVVLRAVARTEEAV